MTAPSPHDRPLSARWRQRLRRLRRPALMGTLRRTTPLSDQWGFDRGTPIDRAYIGAFIRRHAADITGAVLEVQEPLYTGRFGRRVTRAEVVDIDRTNPRATLIADLGRDVLPSAAYDCAVVTQTLHLIEELDAAIANLVESLRPGGVLLATLPAVSRISRGVGVHGDMWRVTPAGAARIVERAAPGTEVEVESYGNVLTAMAFLAGMAAEELRPRELRANDPHFPVIVGVRVTRS
jgi:SAM-dependent methyltransferase